MDKYYCLCCGYKTLTEKPPGTYGICEICGWEDDDTFGKGANRFTIIEARENFKNYGRSDPNRKSIVRKPTSEDERATDWENVAWPGH